MYQKKKTKFKRIAKYSGMVVVHPQYPENFRRYKIDIDEDLKKFNNCYAVNNSVVAFVYGGEFYVHPYTEELIKVLEEEGFCKSGFYVPFSNWDYPEKEKKRWLKVLKQTNG